MNDSKKEACVICGKQLEDDLFQRIIRSKHCAIHLVLDMGVMRLS